MPILQEDVRQAVIESIREIHTPLLANLTGLTRADHLDAIRRDFEQFVAQSDDVFDFWPDAWLAYQAVPQTHHTIEKLERCIPATASS